MIPRAALLIAALLLAACDARRDAGQIVVSAIGGDLRVDQPEPKDPDFARRVMLDATAQGLVRFDAAGQVEPGIAERWIVIDNGMSYIFRLRDATWQDGKPVTAAQVVTLLRRRLAGSGNALRPFLSAIDEIVEMTPQVIEVRLNRPRPDLLKLFAQPDMAIFRARPPGGSGPLRVISMARQQTVLRADVDLTRSPDDVAPPDARNDVRLRAERAALAVARFAAGKSDLVSGGSFADWPLLATVDIAPINRRLDPAAGLFGLAVTERSGFLAEAAHRAVIAAAIDRPAVLAAFTPAWLPVNQLLPEQLDSAALPVAPAWASIPADARLANARRMVAAWQATHPGQLTLRIALPSGPGATLLYGRIGASLRAMGIQPARVGHKDPADLRLIDAVAPYDSARWYLATACAPCGTEASDAIESARLAPDAATRALRIAAADSALAADSAFIPLARPLRWSLVAVRLDRWQGNARAWHPLNHLRNDTK
ncbi:ABC transporter substrate-binding protein [Sphingomonas qilianensis]|uniref:ABC transporter substrate-binding protein n=1 Tax=Sphingomonas qilianensis TaxID=1736690 RepID=A0ABU9XV17_9SPHN